MSAPLWEYVWSSQITENDLRVYGAHGWELVSVRWGDGDRIADAVFKREVKA